MLDINKIYQGDCLELIKQLPEKSIDLTIIDPPYGISFESNAGKVKRFDKIHNDDNLEYFEPIIKEIHRVLKDNTCIFVYCRYDCYSFFYNILVKYFSIKNCLVWEKSKALGGLGDIQSQFIPNYEFILFGHKGRRILWEGGKKRLFGLIKDDSINKPMSLVHPTQKPVPINKLLIETCSNKDDLILDCFMGSGTTALACKQSGRNYIGFEINQEYVNIANKRLNQEVLKL